MTTLRVGSVITKWTPHEWEFKQDRLGRGDFETFFLMIFQIKIMAMRFWLNLQVLVLDCTAELICPEIYIILKKF